MISLAHELFMSEYYTLTLTVISKTSNIKGISLFIYSFLNDQDFKVILANT